MLLVWSLKLRLHSWIHPHLFDQSLLNTEARKKFRSVLYRAVCCGILISLFFSWVWSGSLTLGILFTFLFPPALQKISVERQHREKKQSLTDYLTCLTALQGLLSVGMGFPSALFEISKNSQTPLGQLFGKITQGFERGDSLQAQFKRVETSALDDWVSGSLRIFEIAHRKGLVLTPFVENLVPVIELEIRARNRIRDLENSVKAQAILAMLVPWLLGVVVHFFQPAITDGFVHTLAGKVTFLCILVWEVFGLWLLKQVVRFY